NVPMQQDWRASADGKWYQAMISIDDNVEGLLPGMNALTITHVDAADGPVLTVPIQAVVGGTELGKHRIVFVKNGDGPPEERKVVLGLMNEKMTEVKEGLKEGDEVVLNPKVLL